MDVSCNCGSFKARLTAFPGNSPGRLACYCSDCQAFLHRLGRSDLLDEFGGTEIIPAYPSEIQFLAGAEHLVCHQLSRKGPLRWATSCCNSPIVNTKVGFPWAGIFHTAFTSVDPDALQAIGEIRSRIYGKNAVGAPPFKVSKAISPGDMAVVLPFILKGKILGKHKGSPFVEADDITPICKPTLLTE